MLGGHVLGFIRVSGYLGRDFKYLASVARKIEGRWTATVDTVLSCLASRVCEGFVDDWERLSSLIVGCSFRGGQYCLRLREHLARVAEGVAEAIGGQWEPAGRAEGGAVAAEVRRSVLKVMTVYVFLYEKIADKVALMSKRPGDKAKYLFLMTAPFLDRYNTWGFAVELVRRAFGEAGDPQSLALKYNTQRKGELVETRMPILFVDEHVILTNKMQPPEGLPQRGGSILGYHGLVKPLVEALRSLGFTVKFPRGVGWRPGGSGTVKVKTDVLRGLRPYQAMALKAWLDAGGIGTIVLPTGGGKTHVALAAIAKLKVPTAIFVTTIELAEQWRRKIKEVLGYDAGMLGGGERRIRDITVVIYNSGAQHIDEIYDKFTMHIYDEGHHLPAESFKEIALKSRTWYRMVLSATPKRADGNEILIFALAGPIVYRLSHYDLARRGYLVPVEYMEVRVDLDEDEAAQYHKYIGEYREGKKGALTKAIKAAATAKRKIDALVEIARAELKASPKSKIIVFTQYVDQAEAAARALKKALGEDKVVLLTGKMSKKAREASMEAFKKGRARVLVATTVADEGVDIPDADVAVILSGFSQERQFIQRIGRVVRPAPGKKRAKIVEIVTADTIDEDLYRRRLQALQTEVATVEGLREMARAASRRRAAARSKVEEVLAVELGDDYTLLLQKRVKDLTKKELKALVKAHRSRPPRSWKLDEARKGRVPRLVSTWIRKPDKYDIPGVDTPDAPHAQARKKISKSVSRNIRQAMKTPPDKCTVKEAGGGYVVICYHTVNGKTIPIMHGKYTTKTAAERKKRMILAGKTNKKK